MVCPKFYVGLDESGPLCSDFSVTKGAVRRNLKEWFNLRVDLGVLTGRCATHSDLFGFAEFILADAARLHERSITHEDFELPKVICSASGDTTSFDLSHARASDARGVLVLDARCNLKSYCAKRWKDLYTAMRPSNVSAYLSVWSSSTLDEEGRLCPRSSHGELSLPLSGETLQPCHHYDNGRLGAEARPRGSSAYWADGDLLYVALRN